jgi:hypothetical protein
MLEFCVVFHIRYPSNINDSSTIVALSFFLNERPERVRYPDTTPITSTVPHWARRHNVSRWANELYDRHRLERNNLARYIAHTQYKRETYKWTCILGEYRVVCLVLILIIEQVG